MQVEQGLVFQLIGELYVENVLEKRESARLKATLEEVLKAKAEKIPAIGSEGEK